MNIKRKIKSLLFVLVFFLFLLIVNSYIYDFFAVILFCEEKDIEAIVPMTEVVEPIKLLEENYNSENFKINFNLAYRKGVESGHIRIDNNSMPYYYRYTKKINREVVEERSFYNIEDAVGEAKNMYYEFKNYINTHIITFYKPEPFTTRYVQQNFRSLEVTHLSTITTGSRYALTAIDFCTYPNIRLKNEISSFIRSLPFSNKDLYSILNHISIVVDSNLLKGLVW